MYQGKKWSLRILLSVMLVVALVEGNDQAQSQEKYPTRAIDIICPFAPGGSTDLSARLAAPYLKRKWDVPVNVVNKPGGNTVPAVLEVYRSAPDGYTLLSDNYPPTTMLPFVVKNLPFKVMDRTFLAITATSPMALMVPPTSPFKSLRDLEEEAKKNPGNFTWTSLGGVGGQDFTIRQFFKAIGVDVKKTKPIMCRGGEQRRLA